MTKRQLEIENLKKNNQEQQNTQMLISFTVQEQRARDLEKESQISSSQQQTNEEPEAEKKTDDAIEYIFLPKKSLEEEDEEDKKKATGGLETTYVISHHMNGKVLAYSIGVGDWSDNFHDISDLDISDEEFTNDLHSILRGAASSEDGVRAVEKKYPGSRTYKDSEAKERAAEFLQKMKDRNDIAIPNSPAPSPTAAPKTENRAPLSPLPNTLQPKESSLGMFHDPLEANESFSELRPSATAEGEVEPGSPSPFQTTPKP
ncbi:hypothetical protein [Legionella maioricensis]|uniref:Uncharacterized protein n=1 Tax=Legionella maioricensis TaxID=2896528 RepID=A0A9X2CYD1_9GAMM|nr:hypothetical protein [Legionella maioricensis]MCL9683036.1 hypothetical protein [Legionella maioricensis]MCL9686384.1 hypothetical protein [Legionella maioricensis]